MRTVTGLFDTYQHAADAVRALKDAGIRSADISFIANSPEEIEEVDVIGDDATTGAEVGALIGGAGGLLAGLGLLTIPGLGPVVAGGWLLATAMGAVTGAGIGATAGGLVGSLTSAGVPEHDAHVYAEGVRRGGALVTVRIDDAHAHTAADILQNCGGIDIEDRRQTYQSEGWSRFEHDAITDGKEKDEAPPVVPPLI